MRIDLEVRGVDVTARKLSRLGRRAVDMRPAFDRIADEFIEGERRRFSTGSGWAPLASATKARKRREGLDPRIMHATGRLEGVLTRRSAAGQVLVIDRDSITFGLKGGRSKGYAGVISQRGRKSQPVRKVVVLAQRERRRAKQIILEELMAE